MTPERKSKLQRILRLAELLAPDERSDYISAVTDGDDEMRLAVEASLQPDVSLIQTLVECPKARPKYYLDHPLRPHP